MKYAVVVVLTYLAALTVARLHGYSYGTFDPRDVDEIQIHPCVFPVGSSYHSVEAVLRRRAEEKRRAANSVSISLSRYLETSSRFEQAYDRTDHGEVVVKLGVYPDRGAAQGGAAWWQRRFVADILADREEFDAEVAASLRRLTSDVCTADE
jgi:hypothetical protein